MSGTVEYKKPLPVPDLESVEFWNGLKRHELTIQRCEKCGKHVYYPRSICPHCSAGPESLKWVKASGRGKVYTYAIVRQAAIPSFAPDVPYVLAVVELQEGPHMVTNIVGCKPEEVRCEMLVEIVYDDVTPEITLPKFKPSR
jgi:uncharacterized OB-fold protein